MTKDGRIRNCVWPVLVTLACSGGAAEIACASGLYDPPAPAVYIHASPLRLNVAELSDRVQAATATDVEVADFDGDGANDIAVLWFVNYRNGQRAETPVRALSFFFNEGGGGFARGADLDLYVPDPVEAAMSIFRNGTSELGVGDFDADGDLDLAALPFFGDEIWFVENLGGRNFTQHLRFLFGINSGVLLLTPPEAGAGDIDGDGRAELVYIADPIQLINGQILHFWKTGGGISEMERVEWECGSGALFTRFTRGLAVADFSGDGRSDVAFTGAMDPTAEADPVLTIYYGLNTATQRFQIANFFPGFLCADVVALPALGNCRPRVAVTNRSGTSMEYWSAACAGVLELTLTAEVSGYAGLAAERGMAAVCTDVNGDGNVDLVTKQKAGGVDNGNQIELTLADGTGAPLVLLAPTPFDTTGFENWAASQTLRPRNLAAGDLFGNALPEVVAGFAATAGVPELDSGYILDIAVWRNSCVGDVTRDGRTDIEDTEAVLAVLGTCRSSMSFNADADVDKDGCITAADMEIVALDDGCTCSPCGSEVLGDLNCDCSVDLLDVNPFVVALMNQVQYEALHPTCNWRRADINGDGTVDLRDVNRFVTLLTQ